MRDSAVWKTGPERGANTEETESPATRNDQAEACCQANLFFSSDDANGGSEKDKEIERTRSIVRFILSGDRLGRLI